MWICGGTDQDGIGTLQAGTGTLIGTILGITIGTATGTAIGMIRGGVLQVGHGTAIGMTRGGALYTALYMHHGLDTDLQGDQGTIPDTADQEGMYIMEKEVQALLTMG